MIYAVEARIFNNEKIMAKLRGALPKEESSHVETRTCDIWIDVFDSFEDAKEFLNDYKKV